MNNDIRHLISYISAIDSKYSLFDEVSDNKYNIFQILKIENEEVHFHSKILSDILSPQGLHGMKDTFLNLFINVLLKKSYLNLEFVNYLNEFNSKRTFVKTEYYLSLLCHIKFFEFFWVEMQVGSGFQLILRVEKNKAPRVETHGA